MAIAKGFESMTDIHDGISAVNIALSTPSVVLAAVATTSTYPTGTSLDPADGTINISGANTLTFSGSTPVVSVSFPTNPATNTWSYNYSLSGASITPDNSDGSYDLSAITADNATITFHVKVNDGGNIVEQDVVATIGLARGGASGSAAANANALFVTGDRGAFVVTRDNSGRLSFNDGINGTISLTALPQNVGSGNVTWSFKTADQSSFTQITDDDGAGTSLANVTRGDVQGNSIVLRKENFAFLPSSGTQTHHNLITYQSAIVFESSTYSDTWDIVLDTNAADGIDGTNGSDSFLVDLVPTAGSLSFKNSTGSGTLKAVLIRGGTVTPDLGQSSTLVNSYQWSYTVGGTTTILTNAALPTITGNTSNGTLGGTSGNFNYHTLVVEADGTVLGGSTAGGEVTWTCEIDYTA